MSAFSRQRPSHRRLAPEPAAGQRAGRGRVIREVSAPIASKRGRIDLAGKTLMPGLIDCHVHVVATMVNLGAERAAAGLARRRARRAIMRGMLMRGFTTVRDVGGADVGLKLAVEEGAILGPRLVISGKALSQTGGHADYRGRFDARRARLLPTAGSARSAASATASPRCAAPRARRSRPAPIFIKIMANGGVASPTDPIAFLGFSREEILAVVEEAEMAGTYVAGPPLYRRRDPPRGRVRRPIGRARQPDPAGDRPAHAERRRLGGADARHLRGARRKAQARPAAGVGRQDRRRALAGLHSLEIMRDAGVTMATAPISSARCTGVSRRNSSSAPVPAGARDHRQRDLCRGERGGHERPDRRDRARRLCGPDLVDGDPLADLSLLGGQGEHIAVIMKGGSFVKSGS